MSGLGNANLRLVPTDDEDAPQAAIDVDIAPESEEDTPDIDERGNILSITHGDGSLSISLDGKPMGNVNGPKEPLEWYSNLCEEIADDELSRITEELLVGIADDLQSRKEWIEDRALGIKLLGLKIELPNIQGASDGAPVEGMSKVRHPLLLEAVLDSRRMRAPNCSRPMGR